MLSKPSLGHVRENQRKSRATKQNTVQELEYRLASAKEVKHRAVNDRAKAAEGTMNPGRLQVGYSVIALLCLCSCSRTSAPGKTFLVGRIVDKRRQGPSANMDMLGCKGQWNFGMGQAVESGRQTVQ